MTVPANSPAIVRSLATVLSQAQAWYDMFPGATTADKIANALASIYYPDTTPDTELPLAMLQVEQREATITMVFDPSEHDVADVQAVAESLTYQLQSRFRTDGTGVVIATEPFSGDVLESSDWLDAGGTPTHVINVSASLGITL